MMNDRQITRRLDLRGQVCPGPTVDTRLTLKEMIGADKACTIALVGEAVSLVKDAIAKSIHGVGFPPLPELITEMSRARSPFYISACRLDHRRRRRRLWK